MIGFDSEFTNIEDYILRITDRIWKDRDFDAISRYYGKDTVIHTLGGPVVGSDAVIQGTKDTLTAFPDRRLLAEEVIWSGDDSSGYYSSHRIISPDMTNLGHSVFGPPTGKQATVRTIADCAVRDNQVYEEWLVRDNMGLVMQLGLEPHAVASELARDNRGNKALHAWLQAELERVRASDLDYPEMDACEETGLPDPHKDPEGFVRAVLYVLYLHPDAGMANSIYARDCEYSGPSGRRGQGGGAVLQCINGMLTALGRRSLSVDHVCALPRQGGELSVAVRWTLAGVHNLDGIYGARSGKDVLVLAVSHWRIKDSLIVAEWTVFDELAVLQQIYA